MSAIVSSVRESVGPTPWLPPTDYEPSEAVVCPVMPTLQHGTMLLPWPLFAALCLDFGGGTEAPRLDAQGLGSLARKAVITWFI